MKDAEEKQENPTTLFVCDNKSAITIERNPVFHSRTNHIALKHHFICEAIEEGLSSANQRSIVIGSAMKKHSQRVNFKR